MNPNWSRRKQSWPDLKYYHWIYVKRQRKPWKTCQSPTWCSNHEPPKYKSEVLQLWLIFLVPVLMKSNQWMLWNQVQKIGRVGLQNSWDSLNSLHFFSLVTKTYTFPISIISLIVLSGIIMKLQYGTNDMRIPWASRYNEDNSGSKRNCQ
jgi:hypothetical protein